MEREWRVRLAALCLMVGVGWAVNLYRAKTLMEEAYRRLMGSPEPVSIRMTVRTEGRAKKPDVVITRE